VQVPPRLNLSLVVTEQIGDKIADRSITFKQSENRMKDARSSTSYGLCPPPGVGFLVPGTEHSASS
jgi:hypothetical protein